jgi:DNA-binding transcriptional MocR family regulator
VLGTFEGVMFPSQRLAYLVLPPTLVEPLGQAQALWGARVGVATPVCAELTARVLHAEAK